MDMTKNLFRTLKPHSTIGFGYVDDRQKEKQKGRKNYVCIT